jgi:hypothetical protein
MSWPPRQAAFRIQRQPSICADLPACIRAFSYLYTPAGSRLAGSHGRARTGARGTACTWPAPSARN